MQPGERNAFDQQWLQAALWDHHRIRTLRKSLAEVRAISNLPPYRSNFPPYRAPHGRGRISSEAQGANVGRIASLRRNGGWGQPSSVAGSRDRRNGKRDTCRQWDYATGMKYKSSCFGVRENL